METIDILNDDNWWTAESVPHILVTMDAEDGYYFSLNKSDIKLSQGTLLKATRLDYYTYELEIELDSMANRIAMVDVAEWTGAAGTTGIWTETPNAGYYELRLYRDQKAVGNIYTAPNNYYCFDAAMRKEGNYSYKVRAVNKANNSVHSEEWTEVLSTVYVSEEQAAENRLKYEAGTAAPVDTASLPSGFDAKTASQKGPGGGDTAVSQDAVGGDTAAGGWRQDAIGVWYCNADGSYTTSDWQLINGKWYYFNEQGYRHTGWLTWNGLNYYCDLTTGEMLVNTTVPDGSGRMVGGDGAEQVNGVPVNANLANGNQIQETQSAAGVLPVL